MKLIPYLMFFNGDCREAFDFYAGALGGQIVFTVTYGEMPSEPGQPLLRPRQVARIGQQQHQHQPSQHRPCPLVVMAQRARGRPGAR